MLCRVPEGSCPRVSGSLQGVFCVLSRRRRRRLFCGGGGESCDVSLSVNPTTSEQDARAGGRRPPAEGRRGGRVWGQAVRSDGVILVAKRYTAGRTRRQQEGQALCWHGHGTELELTCLGGPRTEPQETDGVT